MSRLPEYGDEDYRGSEEIEGGGGLVAVGTAMNDVLDIVATQMQLEPACESPIELRLGAYLMRALPDGFVLRPQFQFGRFRMDFAVIDPAGAACLFIECDGKEFHSTPAQRANDAAKNAAAARVHIPLLRFTGAQIFRDAPGCAWAVTKLVRGLA